MGIVPHFAHWWNQSLSTKLRLDFFNIRRTAGITDKNTHASMNKQKSKNEINNM